MRKKKGERWEGRKNKKRREGRKKRRIDERKIREREKEEIRQRLKWKREERNKNLRKLLKKSRKKEEVQIYDRFIVQFVTSDLLSYFILRQRERKSNGFDLIQNFFFS